MTQIFPYLLVIGIVANLAVVAWALIDLLAETGGRDAGQRRWIWIAAILLTQALGAFIYLIVKRRPQR
ncbi:MAG: hypothetical protein HKN91_11415 [Acidimicrobiia bacterium]|nr:hypothetical protein [Acidimicrobiia bacterium]